MSKTTITGKRPYILIFVCAILFFFLSLGISLTESADTGERLIELLKRDYRPVTPLLPPGVEVAKGFREGVGPVIGNVQVTEGKAFVVHKNQKVAYMLKKGHPLFPGDLVVTGEGSRASLRLNDKSVLTLAASTKLTIDKSIYNPQKDDRSSLLKLLFGRARFIVTKISGKSSYRVMTPTAVCGVRGSDFALAVIPDGTRISSNTSILEKLLLVKSAYAQAPQLMTIVVTGVETNVTFAGTVGPTMTVGPTSVTAAVSGAAAMSPLAVAAGTALEALNAIGPGLASLSMPPGGP
ncbi:MAG: FecR domain-containing protein [Deltaproteobacteria bacterium]|nr:FecR domain-containing protein [Deltaproteobacteria bacterium]